ncbi:hypothetical protein KBB68_00095 [Candidatus Babeliales bacterium]|nr:hypothetical protein [Candidatus Babeliales bacterium]
MKKVLILCSFIASISDLQSAYDNSDDDSLNESFDSLFLGALNAAPFHHVSTIPARIPTPQSAFGNDDYLPNTSTLSDQEIDPFLSVSKIFTLQTMLASDSDSHPDDKKILQPAKEQAQFKN